MIRGPLDHKLNEEIFFRLVTYARGRNLGWEKKVSMAEKDF